MYLREIDKLYLREIDNKIEEIGHIGDEKQQSA